MRSSARLSVLASLFLVGCAHLPRPMTPIDDADGALAQQVSLHRTLRAFSAEARVEQRGREGRIRGTVLGMIALPDHVRFDVLTQLGPVAILTSDGERFQLLDMREDRFVEGEACPANVGRLLGFDLPPAEVARLLVGEPPVLPGATERTIRVVDGGYVVTLASAELVEEITFGLREGDHAAPAEDQHLRLRSVVLSDRAGVVQLRITYSDHRVVIDPRDPDGRGIALPFVVRVEDPARQAETTIRIKSIDLGAEPPDDAFTQEAPAGMTPEPSPCP